MTRFPLGATALLTLMIVSSVALGQRKLDDTLKDDGGQTQSTADKALDNNETPTAGQIRGRVNATRAPNESSSAQQRSTTPTSVGQSRGGYQAREPSQPSSANEQPVSVDNSTEVEVHQLTEADFAGVDQFVTPSTVSMQPTFDAMITTCGGARDPAIRQNVYLITKAQAKSYPPQVNFLDNWMSNYDRQYDAKVNHYDRYGCGADSEEKGYDQHASFVESVLSAIATRKAQMQPAPAQRVADQSTTTPNTASLRIRPIEPNDVVSITLDKFVGRYWVFGHWDAVSHVCDGSRVIRDNLAVIYGTQNFSYSSNTPEWQKPRLVDDIEIMRLKFEQEYQKQLPIVTESSKRKSSGGVPWCDTARTSFYPMYKAELESGVQFNLQTSLVSGLE